ncbi:hypothetical protein [Nocardia lasii]|uniref:Uncharacterized protein n=1 Tax=Nocardia lasii TaxID=1616107 RepID=A0ABW1JLK7_9NOCA
MTDQNTGNGNVATPGAAAPRTEVVQTGSKEARYRVERNNARAEVEALTARIEGYQRAEVERIAAKNLAAPGDVFTIGDKTLADFLTAEGGVDTAAVESVAQAIIGERPGLGTRQRATDFTQGSGNPGTPVKASPSWGEFLAL